MASQKEGWTRRRKGQCGLGILLCLCPVVFALILRFASPSMDSKQIWYGGGGFIALYYIFITYFLILSGIEDFPSGVIATIGRFVLSLFVGWFLTVIGLTLTAGILEMLKPG